MARFSSSRENGSGLGHGRPLDRLDQLRIGVKDEGPLAREGVRLAGEGHEFAHPTLLFRDGDEGGKGVGGETFGLNVNVEAFLDEGGEGGVVTSLVVENGVVDRSIDPLELLLRILPLKEAD